MLNILGSQSEKYQKANEPLDVAVFSIPNREGWKVFATWGIAALAGFPLIYGTTNYLASQRGTLFDFWFDWELGLPFIPEFIWVYMSLNLAILLPLFMVDARRLKLYCQTNLATLFAAAGFFALFPTHLGFERPMPEDPRMAAIFQNIYSLDRPHNLVPSLHVTFSALALLAIMEAHPKRKWIQILFPIWLILTAMSVVLIRQHHVMDVVGGAILAYVGMKYIYYRRLKKVPATF